MKDEFQCLYVSYLTSTARFERAGTMKNVIADFAPFLVFLSLCWHIGQIRKSDTSLQILGIALLYRRDTQTDKSKKVRNFNDIGKIFVVTYQYSLWQTFVSS